MQKLANYISVDENVQFGKPVFKGTRVPVQSLFWHLEKGISLDAFLEDFSKKAGRGGNRVGCQKI